MFAIDSEGTRRVASSIDTSAETLHGCAERVASLTSAAPAAVGQDSSLLTRHLQGCLDNFAGGLSALTAGLEALSLDLVAVARDAAVLDASVASEYRGAMCVWSVAERPA